jgi:hypothetical protein
VVLLRAREKRLRRGSELSTTARRWRPEMARGVVARAREARKGEERGRDRGEMTRGRCSSWRWSSERGIGGERRWQERRREGSGACQRKTKQGGVRGTCS